MPGSPLVRWGAGDDAPVALVCVPWTGVGAAPFAAWPEHLGADAAVWAVRLAGRESRFAEPPLDRTAPIVKEIAEAVTRTIAGPVALFGQCSGSLIAFELAHVLADAGRVELTQLLVASQEAPARTLVRRREADPRDELRALGLFDEAVMDDELFDLMRPALEADMRMLEHYRSEGWRTLSIPITAFTGRADTLLEHADVPAWADETTGGFELVELEDCDHVFSGEGRIRLARAVGDRLIAAAERP